MLRLLSHISVSGLLTSGSLDYIDILVSRYMWKKKVTVQKCKITREQDSTRIDVWVWMITTSSDSSIQHKLYFSSDERSKVFSFRLHQRLNVYHKYHPYDIIHFLNTIAYLRSCSIFLALSHNIDFEVLKLNVFARALIGPIHLNNSCLT